MRELILVGIGNSGINIADQYIKQIASEHGID
jgi:hypothetical protein